jgi:hypothetical protein
MIIIKNNKNKFVAIIAFSLIQLIIYFTNRSQILYINSGGYDSFYILLFIALYPFGFVLGSLFNQLFIERLGENGTYVILFNITCIALSFNQLYESYWSWLLFRFIFSFCIARLYWIANDHIALKNKNYFDKISYNGVIKLSIIRFTNIFSNILISTITFSYNKVVTISVILLQLAQTFFSLNNKHNLSLAKNTHHLKFYIDIYINLYKKNPLFCLYFLLLNGLHYTYLTWVIIIISHFKNIHYFFKFLIIFFALGEIFSTYIFLREDNSIAVKKRITWGLSLFAIINFFLFLVFSLKNYNLILPLFFLSGVIISKLNGDLDHLVFSSQKIVDKINFDFSNSIIKNVFSIVILIITYHIAAYKAYGIFIFLFIIYFSFLILLLFKKISLHIVEE